MNTEEIKITVPEGYEIDKENSTFECIKFKKKGLTYDDVAKKLFEDKVCYYLGQCADIVKYKPNLQFSKIANNATSEKQLQRLLAINKLINVAEYLNDGWKPDWQDPLKSKWYILWDNCSNKFEISYCNSYTSGAVYFKTPDLALQTIKILGEEEIKLALGV